MENISNNNQKVNKDNYLSILSEQTILKYSTLLDNKEYYSFLLQIKSALRKTIRLLNKDTENDKFESLCFFCATRLSETTDPEALVDFLNFLCDEIAKSDMVKESFLLSFFLYAYNKLPKMNKNKQSIQIRLLKLFLEQKKIPSQRLRKNGYYRKFAEDNLFDENPISAYKFAIFSEDYDIIETIVDIHKTSTTIPIENLYLVVRIVFELLLLENRKMATYFLVKKVISHDLNNNKKEIPDFSNSEEVKKFCETNHPLINFCFSLLSTLGSLPWENLASLFKNYQKWLDNGGGFLKKYLNQISLQYYKKPLVREQANMGIFSMLSNFMN